MIFVMRAPITIAVVSTPAPKFVIQILEIQWSLPTSDLLDACREKSLDRISGVQSFFNVFDSRSAKRSWRSLMGYWNSLEC